MAARWAVCKCFYEKNLFLPALGHVTYRSRTQFIAVYADRLKQLNIDEIVSALEDEIQRRREIRPNIEINRAKIRDQYTPANKRLFVDTEYFDLPRSIEGVSEDIPGVFTFPLLPPSQCTELLLELDHFTKSGLEHQRPNSMNKNGILLEELGLEPQISRLVRAVEPLAKAKFPDLVGPEGLDSVKAFTVDYSADGSPTADVELATHFDNSEVTLNIPLTDCHEGSELLFETKAGFKSVSMSVGRAILHSGRMQHGVLPISEGRRCNLIIWMRSSSIRNRKCPMCGEPPDLVEVSLGKGDGFTIQAA